MQRDITDEVGKCRAMNNLITHHSCTASGQKKKQKTKKQYHSTCSTHVYSCMIYTLITKPYVSV